MVLNVKGMKMSTGYRTAGKRLAPLVLAAGAAGLAISSPAQANLTISLQLAGSTAGAPITSQAIVGTAAIEIDVWAQITPNLPAGSYAGNGTAGDYAFQSSYFGVLSTQVNPSGDVATSGGLTSAALESWDKGTGATPGVIADTNGDGATDIGSSPENILTEPNIAYAVGNTSNNSSPTPIPANDSAIPVGDVMSLPGGGFEFLLEKVYYTPSATDATTLGRKITYSPIIPTSTSGGPAIWVEDGPTYATPATPGIAKAGKIYNTSSQLVNDPGNFLAGSSVLLYVPGVVPEPTSLSLLGVGAAGLLARRRKT